MPPWSSALVGVAGAKHRRLIEQPADDLQREGRPASSKPLQTDNAGLPATLNGEV